MKISNSRRQHWSALAVGRRQTAADGDFLIAVGRSGLGAWQSGSRTAKKKGTSQFLLLYAEAISNDSTGDGIQNHCPNRQCLATPQYFPGPSVILNDTLHYQLLRCHLLRKHSQTAAALLISVAAVWAVVHTRHSPALLPGPGREATPTGLRRGQGVRT
jgi:hypothetical protein